VVAVLWYWSVTFFPLVEQGIFRPVPLILDSLTEDVGCVYKNVGLGGRSRPGLLLTWYGSIGLLTPFPLVEQGIFRHSTLI
jgi:hypothetical protein